MAQCYELVDRVVDIQPALTKLRELEAGATASTPFLAVDCEGEKLSRKGVLAVVSVATERHTILFDVKTLGAKVFDLGLRALLEDPDRKKLMFDCREDSDCLWNQFKVKLTNVLDLQLMQAIHEETHPMPRSKTGQARRHLGSAFQPRLRGFFMCLEVYVKDQSLLAAKRNGKFKMERQGAWLERPLDAALLAYAAADVQGFFSLYRALTPGPGNTSDMERLRVGSERYLDFHRLKEVRLYDQYEGNSYLPWRVIPRRYQVGSYGQDEECQGCKRRFPASDFSFPGHCPVCTKVQLENGDCFKQILNQFDIRPR